MPAITRTDFWTRCARSNLANNALSGLVPPTLGNLAQLVTLNLAQNNLSGPLPSLAALSSLQSLLVANNSLSGSFPPWLARLPFLQSADFSNNNLNGTLPDVLGSGSLVALGLAGNAFGGALPPSLVASRAASIDGTPVTLCDAGSFAAYAITSGGVGSPTFPLPVCKPCPPGSVAPARGATRCDLCPVDAYALPGALSCAMCPPNSASPLGTPSAAGCACNPGYVAAPGQAPGAPPLCRLCPPGTYYFYTGGGRCDACAPGTYFPLPGAASCSLPPLGAYANATATGFGYCAPGAFLNGETGACAPCMAGTYAPSAAATTCLPVPPGFVVVTRAAIGAASPSPPASPAVGVASPPPPVAAVVASPPPPVAAVVASPPLPIVAPSAAVAVAPCAAGTFASAGTCQPCAPGTWAPAAATFCAVCGAGLYTSPNGATCTACPSGATSPPLSVGASACACLPGTAPTGVNGTCAARPARPAAALSPAALGGLLGGVTASMALLAAVAVVLTRRALCKRSGWKAFVARADEVALGELLGSGGYGTVHAATWRGTAVAVKLFPSQDGFFCEPPEAGAGAGEGGLESGFGGGERHDMAPAGESRADLRGPFDANASSGEGGGGWGSQRKKGWWRTRAGRGVAPSLHTSHPMATMSSADPVFAREVEFLGQMRHPHSAWLGGELSHA